MQAIILSKFSNDDVAIGAAFLLLPPIVLISILYYFIYWGITGKKASFLILVFIGIATFFWLAVYLTFKEKNG